MKNNFSKAEIKNSVECKWRKYQIKSLVITYLFIAVICLFVIAFCGLEKNYRWHDLKVLIIIWLIVIISIGLVLLPIFLYYLVKLCYVLNHYQDFLCYEVILEHYSTSFNIIFLSTFCILYYYN